jgi:hypothetical protein
MYITTIEIMTKQGGMLIVISVALILIVLVYEFFQFLKL